MTSVEREAQRMVFDMPGELRPQLVILVTQISKAIRSREISIEPVVEPVDVRWPRDEAVVDHGAKRPGLDAATPVKIGRRVVMNDVNGSAGWTAPEQR